MRPMKSMNAIPVEIEAQLKALGGRVRAARKRRKWRALDLALRADPGLDRDGLALEISAQKGGYTRIGAAALFSLLGIRAGYLSQTGLPCAFGRGW